MARSRARGRRTYRRYRPRISGIGNRMVVVRRGASAAANRLKAEAQRTKDRVIAAMIAGGYGLAEKNDAFSSVPALFDDPAHTFALTSAALAMVSKGALRTVFDHVANAMVPVSAYKLGRNGFDSANDGFLSGIAGDLDGED